MGYADALSARNAYLVELLKYVGIQEGSTYHQAILAAYNKITPLPRQHRATGTDSWCAIFLNGIGWELGFRCWPWECSCTMIREEAKSRGIWRDGWTGELKPGDWILYNWDGKGGAEHIGAVCAIIGNAVCVVEGNYDDAVKIRRLIVGDSRVEGSVALDFDELVEAAAEEEVEAVVEKRWQTLEELPEWAKPTISKLVKLGWLRGDGAGLELSYDMVRLLVVNDRAGLYDRST